MIKKFTEFLNESSGKLFKVADLFTSLTRNYESKKMFYTDLLQFVGKEEHRNWEDLRVKSKLEETRTEKCYYKFIFALDGKSYTIEIIFDAEYMGKNEKDVPETASDVNLNRLNTVLTNIKIKKIDIKSNVVDYNATNPSDVVKNSCIKFIIKMMAVDYDTLGEKLFNFEQN